MAPPTTMKAWQWTAISGGLEKSMVYSAAAAAPPDKLSPDEIRVEVVSSSINPIDYKLPELGLLGKMIIGTPASPGLDFSGRVVSTGAAVNSLKPGQAVFGRLEKPMPFGSLGQFVVGTGAGTVELPAGVDPDQGAAIGTAGLTAYQCIVPFVKSGDRVFINGGSGGTGTFGIQIAKTLGCHVTASCSTPNVSLCKELGADEVIDYKTTDIAKALREKGRVFSLVVDNVGTPAELYKESDHFLQPSGKFVQVGAPVSVGAMAQIVSRMFMPSLLGGGRQPFKFVGVKNKQEDLVQIGKWMQEGRVRAVIDSTFAYEDAPKAFERLKTGRARGKVVVHVGG